MKNELASETRAAPTRGRSSGVRLILGAFVLLAVFVAYSFVQRWHSEQRLASWTRARAIQNVSVVEPTHNAKPDILSLPGTISAWYEASIYAQVTGYIQSWKTDIGAVVKKGDLLAVVDTPELDDRIAKAVEEVNRAKAALEFAKVTADRWAALRQSSAVSKQAADEKAADEQAKQADLGAAKANLERLKAQKAFAQIVSPFDGVVIARNIDIGSFVAPGRNAKPLFKVADIHAVRLYVEVPQVYSAVLTKGMKVVFTTPQRKDRKFNGEIATTSNAIGAKTGSLLVEVDAPNSDGALFPGSYANASFELPINPRQLRIPASALSVGKDNTRVAVVESDGRVKFKDVVIAKDLGSEIVLASGVGPHDRIVNNPPETLADGDQVRISSPEPADSRK
jgi:membrane fusion protein, multidrug efflux system